MAENSSTVISETRHLSTSDVAEYRDLRLAGLQAHPEAFGASWEEEAA
ncbi:hypothetical protein [Muricoccus aerilatus]|nr:hypothetical protein [Roseomonas aerilata]